MWKNMYKNGQKGLQNPQQKRNTDRGFTRTSQQPRLAGER